MNRDYEARQIFRSGFHLGMQLVAEALSNPPELYEETCRRMFKILRQITKNPDLPINFNIKMNLVQELSEALKKMGKRIKVSYF